MIEVRFAWSAWQARADLASEREQKLRKAFSELVYWARDIAGDCDDPEQRKQEDEMMGRMSALLAELDEGERR